MIFSQLGSYFGRPGRQGVDGNLTGLFSFSSTNLACQAFEEEAIKEWIRHCKYDSRGNTSSCKTSSPDRQKMFLVARYRLSRLCSGCTICERWSRQDVSVGSMISLGEKRAPSSHSRTFSL